MIDRELLELAARAGGIKQAQVMAGWNSLVDDGDAFRLLIKIGGKLDQDHPGYAKVSWGPFQDFQCVQVYSPTDYERATREAITRAAAEIGKAMG